MAEVTADGRGLTGRAGVAALVELADRFGLTRRCRLRPAVVQAGTGARSGVVLRDLVVMLADGGDDFSAIEVLRGQAELLGRSVASDSTAWRRVADLAADELATARLDGARKRTWAAVWAAGGAPPAVADPGRGRCASTSTPPL